jgi:hypothetical protein
MLFQAQKAQKGGQEGIPSICFLEFLLSAFQIPSFEGMSTTPGLLRPSAPFCG